MREGFEAIGATKAEAGVILGHFNMTWFCYSCASQIRKCDRGISILKNARAKCQWYMLDISYQKYLPPPSLPFWQNLNDWVAFRAHMFMRTGSWFIHHPRKLLRGLLLVTDTLRGPDLCSARLHLIASRQAGTLKGSDMLYCCCLGCQETNSNKIVAQH